MHLLDERERKAKAIKHNQLETAGRKKVKLEIGLSLVRVDLVSFNFITTAHFFLLRRRFTIALASDNKHHFRVLLISWSNSKSKYQIKIGFFLHFRVVQIQFHKTTAQIEVSMASAFTSTPKSAFLSADDYPTLNDRRDGEASER